MPIIVTKNLRDEVFQSKRRARSTYHVSGVTNPDEAAVAEATDGSLSVPRVGEAHPRDSDLVVVEEPEAQRLALDYFLVSVVWAPAAGIEGGGIEELADGGVLVRREYATRDFKIDRTPEGNHPVVNSNRRPFDDAPSAPRPVFFITAIARQVSFSDALALDYIGAVNSDTLVIAGRNVAGPGNAMLVSLAPTADAVMDKTPIDVAYRFELRSGSDPFRTRLLDRDTVMTVNDGGTPRVVPVYTNEAPPQPVAEPVLLDGKGLIYPAVRDHYSGGAQLTITSHVYSEQPLGSEIEDTGSAVFLRYQLYRTRPFAVLGLG